jgi:hypothetical protein
MVRRSIFVGAGVLGLLAAAAFAALDDNPKEPASPDVAQQVKALTQRVTALEKQVAELERRQSVFLVPQPRGSVPPGGLLPDGLRIPDDWERREFNGRPYYIVPAEQPRRK